MKAKTIKAVLFKKIGDWIESIEDTHVQDVVRDNVIVTGGALVSLLTNEKPNDYDIYFKNKEAALIVAKYYVNKWNELNPKVENKLGHQEKVFVLDGADVDKWKRGEVALSKIAPNYRMNHSWKNICKDPEQLIVSHMVTNTPADRIKLIFPSDGVVGKKSAVQSLEKTDDLEAELLQDLNSPEEKKDKGKYHPVFITTNAITLSDKIQVIFRFYGSPQEIHDTYDFEHCKCYWQSWDRKLSTPINSLLAIMNKSLEYTGSRYPICSLIRLRKFIKRGYNINAGQILKMCMQVNELDLSDLDVLEDQLFGVDTVYFMQLVDQLRKAKQDEPGTVLDATYVATIIDRVF